MKYRPLAGNWLLNVGSIWIAFMCRTPLKGAGGEGGTKGEPPTVVESNHSVFFPKEYILLCLGNVSWCRSWQEDSLVLFVCLFDSSTNIWFISVKKQLIHQQRFKVLNFSSVNKEWDEKMSAKLGILKLSPSPDPGPYTRLHLRKSSGWKPRLGL